MELVDALTQMNELIEKDKFKKKFAVREINNLEREFLWDYATGSAVRKITMRELDQISRLTNNQEVINWAIQHGWNLEEFARAVLTAMEPPLSPILEKSGD